MEIHLRELDKALIVDITGEIDLFTSPRLREFLLPLYKMDQRPILLNLNAVEYIDSSGLATLIEGLQISRKNARKYGLFGLSQRVRNVFEVSRLTEAFLIFPDESTARAGIHPQPSEEKS